MTGKRGVWVLIIALWAALSAASVAAQSANSQNEQQVFLPMLAGYEVAATPVPAPPQAEPVYALLGRLESPAGSQYSYYLLTADNRIYGLVGDSPVEDAAIEALAQRGPDTQVKVWGMAYPRSEASREASIVVTGILSAALTPTPQVAGPPMATVRFSLVTLREGPSQATDPAGSVVYNQRCEVIGRDTVGMWLLIDCGDGTRGWIDIRLVEVEGSLNALPLFAPVATPTPTPPPAPTATPAPSSQIRWRVTLFANMNLAEPAVAQAYVDAIDFDWGYGAPSPLLPVDGFSMRFESRRTFATGLYQFRARADDGVRVWLDNQLLIDGWNGNSGSTYVASRNLSGVHDLRLEYYEASGLASLWFDLQSYNQAPDWQAQYFGNTSLTGPALVTQQEPRSSMPLNFDWGYDSPIPGVIPADLWSARWRGNFVFNSSDYIFRAISDDGVRVYLNGLRVIDQWRDGYNNVTNRFVGVGPGLHEVVVEFYERTGRAQVQVWWSPAPPEVGPR